jgi:hypothetical protein
MPSVSTSALRLLICIFVKVETLSRGDHPTKVSNEIFEGKWLGVWDCESGRKPRRLLLVVGFG